RRARAFAAAPAVGVIGGPRPRENRAPSSIALEQWGQRAIGDPASRKRDFVGRIVLALHHEDPAGRGRDQRQQEQREQGPPAARPILVLLGAPLGYLGGVVGFGLGARVRRRQPAARP